MNSSDPRMQLSVLITTCSSYGMGAFKNVFIFEIKLYPFPSSFPAPWAFPLSFPEPIPCFCILKLVTLLSLITVVTYVCYMYAFDC